jgi:hypothetical protein
MDLVMCTLVYIVQYLKCTIFIIACPIEWTICITNGRFVVVCKIENLTSLLVIMEE